MKYVSFTLYGNKPIYNVGAVRNAELMNKIYPDWRMILYYDKTVPKDTIDKLSKLNVELVDMTNSNIFGNLWRFIVVEKEDCEYAIFRDCDSRIGQREKEAVDDWIRSGKTLHVMRDHPGHGVPCGANGIGILAGMWGLKGRHEGMTKKIIEFHSKNKISFCSDQSFLQEIYSKYNNDRCTHDDFFEKKPFPTKRTDTFFVGGRIDVDDKPLHHDHLTLLHYDNTLKIYGR